MKKASLPLPSMQDITDFLRTQEGKVGKRDISRAFKVHGADRVALKHMLKQMKEEGIITHASKNNITVKGELSPKTPAEITGEDSSGNLIARPLNWTEDTPVPQIIISAQDTPEPLKSGDMVLLKTEKVSLSVYNGVFVRKLSYSPNRMVGLFSAKGQNTGGIVTSVDKRVKARFYISKEDSLNALPNSVVIIELATFRGKSAKAKIIKVICQKNDAYAATLISAYQNNLPIIYPAGAVKQAEALRPPALDKREDLRTLPLVTIDGDDAKDFDDAILALPDDDKGNKDGWLLLIAIADIAFFVRPDTLIDREARTRGNSVYFPDRAVPMLPANITDDMGSLLANKDRPALTAHIKINKYGEVLSFSFARSMIRSFARLTYEDVEQIITGANRNHPLKSEIGNLYNAYLCLKQARDKRCTLNIETDEKSISFSDTGKITSVKPRPRLESYKIVEEFMIAANVAAAATLERLKMPVMYRVHEKPSAEKISDLNAYLAELHISEKIPLSPKPTHFNRILQIVQDTVNKDNVTEMILRTQSRAVYSPENIGHFGLGLESYAHFTSPIRRYADLMVHRALISGLKLGAGGLNDTDDIGLFKDTAEHISFTERRAEEAERDAESRYIALYLSDKIGQVFNGKIRGVSHAGLFVSLCDTGAEGFVPISSLPNDFFIYNGDNTTLIGQKTGKTYKIGQEVRAVLEEATIETGGIIFSLLDDNGRRGNFRKALAKEPADRRRFGTQHRPHHKKGNRHPKRFR